MEDCEVVFTALEEYLHALSCLANPQSGETLYLYLGVSDDVVNLVPISEAVGTQHRMLYVSDII